jgi:hypothetical protein
MLENSPIYADSDFQQCMTEFWSSWFRVPPGFGREISLGRVFLDSSRDFIDYVESSRKGMKPAYVTVQPFTNRDTVSTVEKLFFDFDDEQQPENAWKEAACLAETLKKYYGAEAFCCFSGKKGYHIYVWLQKPLELESGEQAKRFYKTAQTMILKGLRFQTFDRSVFGDVKRIARVPYSINEKSLQLCIPVTRDKQPCLVFETEIFKQHGLNSEFTQACLRSMEAIKSREQERQRLRHTLAPNVGFPGQHGNVKVRPCINAALTADLTAKNGHAVRIAVAVEYLRAGYTSQQTAELFKNQNDYNFGKSLFYVQDILERGYKPFKCATIRDLGFCLPDCEGRQCR